MEALAHPFRASVPTCLPLSIIAVTHDNRLGSLGGDAAACFVDGSHPEPVALTFDEALDWAPTGPARSLVAWHPFLRLSLAPVGENPRLQPLAVTHTLSLSL